MRIAQILRDGSDNLFAPTLECERTVTERFVGREFDGQQIANEGDNQLEMIVALQPFECADTGAGSLDSRNGVYCPFPPGKKPILVGLSKRLDLLVVR